MDTTTYWGISGIPQLETIGYVARFVGPLAIPSALLTFSYFDHRFKFQFC